jgi:hypothetical protein
MESAPTFFVFDHREKTPHFLLFIIFYFKKEGGAGLSPCAPYKWVTAG